MKAEKISRAADKLKLPPIIEDSQKRKPISNKESIKNWRMPKLNKGK